MSSQPTAATAAPQDVVRTPEERWVPIGALALFLLAVAPTLPELVREWILRPEYSHGFLMPPIAAWVLWGRREELRRLRLDPSLVGTVLLALNLVFLLLGEMKLSWFLKPYALVGGLGSLVWALYGWRAFRLCLPALIVLFLMCPLPGRVERALTLPLKQSAALLATGLLDISGIDASLEGNMLHLPGIDSLWVADACSGIRSLISLTSLAILALIFWQRSIWLRLAVLAACVPIAVGINGVRIWLTGFLSVKISPDAAQGFFHFFEGFAMFFVAALLLWAWAMVLNLFFGGARQ